jgi:hypothetical protein
MAEFGYDARQELAPGAAAILENIRPCTRRPQLVMHENLSPNINLRGNPVASCGCTRGDAQYAVRFSGNIAVPTGGTAGAIQLAMSVNGQILPLTIATATPAAVEQFWHVSGEKTIYVPSGCCPTVTVVNASVSADPATTPAPTIALIHLNVTVKRTA